ncbi:MAG: MATE family efflux transporter, partial [Bacteroidota bacterium]
MAASSTSHPQPEAVRFNERPHRTFVALSIPVLFSLVAEPVTGLVDTAFVAQLGAEALAGLGVGTIVLSGVFWAFNFLGIGTQTEVAQAFGGEATARARQITGLAMALGVGIGVAMIALGLPLAEPAAVAMGGEGAVTAAAVEYMRVRLFGTPAVLVTMVAFGTMRGMQDMRTPLWIAVGVNALNVILDPLLIFGYGPIPTLGVAGAAGASTIAQWLGAVWAVGVLAKRLGRPARLPVEDIRKLLRIGGDLFVRTGFLLSFLVLATRSATTISAEAGAAHQAIRQVWVFTALFLDAFALTAQSLVGYFYGAGAIRDARRVAGIAVVWSLATGIGLAGAMLMGERWVADLLVPASAVALFGPAWALAALTQPFNALAFATDGVHWGTSDFRYIRNATVLATLIGAAGLYVLDE